MREHRERVREAAETEETPAEALGGRRREGFADLAPGLLAVGLLLLLAAVDGGFRQTITYPVGLLLAGLLSVVLVVRRPRITALGLPVALALGLLVAFTAWSFASIGWAEVRGISFEAADRALIYTLVFALFALIPWSPRTATIALAVYAVGIAGTGSSAVLAAAGAEDAALSFVNGRFAEPTNYSNAAAALFMGGFWPAAFLASRSYVAWPLRGVLLAVAGLTLQLALLPQSRGAVYVFPIALLVYLAVVPLRIRASIALVPVLVATALVAGPALDVYGVAGDGGDVGSALSAARDAMILSFLVLLVLGIAMALADGRLEIRERTLRRLRVASASVTGAVAVVALIAVAAIGPFTWLGDRWEDFKSDYDKQGFGDTRFSGDLGSNRYDFWRVAVEDQLARAPLVGGGADNFAVDYLRHRRSDEQPLHPHSLPLRVLGGTGVIGLLLLGGALVAMLVAALRVRAGPGRDPLARGVAAVAVASFGYWFLHSGGDWLWSFVAIGGAVFAWLGMAAALGSRSSTAASGEKGELALPGARSKVPALAAAVAVAAVALVAFVPGWLSAREISVAASTWRADPQTAFERLERARSLDPFGARADLTAGAIATQIGDEARAREAFASVLERESTNWYALLELGALEALDGNLAKAKAHLSAAAELNPREPLIRLVMRRAAGPDPLSIEEIDEKLLSQACAVVGRTHETPHCDN